VEESESVTNDGVGDAVDSGGRVLSADFNSRKDADVESDAPPAERDVAESEPLTGKAATQERILIAATNLFLSRGYETTTIAQVAEQASVSRATVFWHFSDKESLFRECFNRICEPFRVSLARDFSHLPPEQRLKELVQLYQTFTDEHRIDVEGFVRWATEHTNFRDWLIRTIFDLHHRFGAVVTEAIAEIVPANKDPHAIAMSILIMLHGGLLLSHFDGSERFAETRRMGIGAILDMIPRRGPKGI